MTRHEKSVRDLALEWIVKADDNFDDADTLLSPQRSRLGGVAFNSQQCAEKYLKAFLVARSVEFPRTHDITELLGLAATVDAALAESLHDARGLTPYGDTIRYPGDFPDVTRVLAEEALEIASKVREAVREALGEFLGGEACEGTGKP